MVSSSLFQCPLSSSHCDMYWASHEVVHAKLHTFSITARSTYVQTTDLLTRTLLAMDFTCCRSNGYIATGAADDSICVYTEDSSGTANVRTCLCPVHHYCALESHCTAYFHCKSIQGALQFLMSALHFQPAEES